MDVLVKISRYFGRWLLNPQYQIISVLSEQGERVVLIHEDKIEGTAAWLEVASKTDVSIVRVEPAKSLQKFSTALADEVVLRLSPEAMPERS